MPGITRVLVAAVALVGCGGGPAAVKPTPPPVATAFAGAEWVPARPTYLLASHHVRDAQRSLHDLVDSFGMLLSMDPADVSRELQRFMGVDALSSEALTAIGIDVEAGISMFSEDLNPTLVVHLAGADQFQAFIDRNRASGLATQSQIVDGTEVFTVKVERSTHISWAIANDWLWVHIALPFAHDDGVAWFTGSHTPHSPTWSDAWAWADRAAAHAGLSGFADLHELVASLAARVPDLLACAQLASPVARVSVSVEGDGRRAGGRIGVELGPAAATLTKAILPPPAGWSELAKQAPLALQWNLDLEIVRAQLAPCLRSLNLDIDGLKELYIRTARAILQTLDVDALSGTGVASFDLVGRTFFAKYLDKIPGRSMLEKDRNFGPYPGHSVAVPFVATVDYILTDKVAFAGMGDGLLARAIGSGPGSGGPIAEVDIHPNGLPADTWGWLIAHVPRWGPPPKSLLEHFQRWQDGRIAATIEGTELVLSASGNRR
jgi:hypothetical protein